MSLDPILTPDDGSEILGWLGRVPGRVLVLGPGGSGIAERWNAAGAIATHLSTPDEVTSGDARWDVVYLVGVLESERWDRWLLQRLHARLEPQGLLVVVTQNLLDLASLPGLVHLVSRVAQELGRRLAPRTAIPTADRSIFRGRRYRTSRLRAMIEGVGYEVVSQSILGNRLPRPVAAALGAMGRESGRHIVMVARRLPSLWGVERPFPSAAETRDGYRRRHAATVAARDTWRATAGLGESGSVDVRDWARRGALVLAPHPDDEVIGCGGTLLDIAELGGSVTLVQVTDGSDSAAFTSEPESVRTRVRLEEAQAVAQRLGARELVCFREDNRALRATPGLRARFRETLERVGAGVVFAPSFTDIHPDHQTVLRLLVDAMRELAGPLPEVALYEVWSLVSPTHVHDVSPRIREIEELLLLYETALKIDDYVHLVAERLMFNAYEHLGRPGYAEVYQVFEGRRFIELGAERFKRSPEPG